MMTSVIKTMSRDKYWESKETMLKKTSFIVTITDGVCQAAKVSFHYLIRQCGSCTNFFQSNRLIM